MPFSCPGFTASCAAFDAGLNDALPSSKGAPALCPSNIISEGFSRSTLIDFGFSGTPLVAAFVGLNNGAGRGSMDQVWLENLLLVPPPAP